MRIASAAALLVLVSACKPSPSGAPSAPASAAPSSGVLTLQGAGATFPFPLYSKWVAEYQRVDPKVRINYQSIGSGGGIRQITERTVDFGASDTPMSDEELAKAPSKLLHIPMTMGAVALAYNLAEAPSLKLTPEVAAGIFLGEIKTWSDPKLAKANAGTKLPNAPITVVHRSDGSGTTAVFTEYLARVSPAWKSKVGAGKSVNFPLGLGAKGNEGVAGQVKTNPGSIGYLELAYATETNLSVAALENAAKKFVAPSLEGVSASAAGVPLTDDLRMSIVNSRSADAYPISAFTYILVYQQQANEERGRGLLKFLAWALHDGQAFGPKLHYAPLPADVVAKADAMLKSVNASGKPLL